MINNVVLVGRLTKPVDLRYTSSGTAVGSFSLAVTRSYANQQGERGTDFINCVIWRKAAENLANFTRKGSLIGIEGRIETRNYENQQGQRVYVTEVVVTNFSLLESKSVTENRPIGDTSTNYTTNHYQSSASSSPSSPYENSFMDNGEFIDISDDDLPF